MPMAEAWRELCLNKLGDSSGLESCAVPFLKEIGWDLKACGTVELSSDFGVPVAAVQTHLTGHSTSCGSSSSPLVLARRCHWLSWRHG